MRKLFEKFNYLTNMSILQILIFGIIGAYLLIYPASSLRIISYVIAGLFILIGILLVMRGTGNRSLFDSTTTGVCILIPGIIIMMHPELLETLIPIFIGTWIIINSVVRLRLALALRELDTNSYLFPMLIAILELCCGIILLENPTVGSLSITAFIGIIILVYAISDLVDMIILKKDLHDIYSYFNDFNSEIKAKISKENIKEAKYKEKNNEKE